VGLLFALLVASSTELGGGQVPRPPLLDVPYLPQTDALCGGAAAAMVFRYWGDRHADIQPFVPLVDRQAGGIANDVLVDAIRRREWQALELTGTIDALRDQLAAGHPVILLLENRPGRYHYVVAVGADASRVFVHDPEWGPSRALTVAALTRAWRGAHFWALVVLPPEKRAADGRLSSEPVNPAAREAPKESEQAAGPAETTTPCDRLLADAIAEIGSRGIDSADDILTRVRVACPDAAGPLAELAGVRFAERRWGEAAALAEQASSRDAANRYAWDVLGSSRFMLDDLDGALEAWNHIGKPRIDGVTIEGLEHTRYALAAQALSLEPNTLLTEERFRLAERRLQQLPDRLSSRVGYRPEGDGFATVDVAVVERPVRPSGPIAWSAEAAATLVNREVTTTIPGGGGEGELWTASWRWWNDRPRVAVGFAAPRVGRLPGVWQVDAAWDAQTFEAPAGTTLREERTHVGASVTNWLTANWRYDLSAGADSWDGVRRTISIGGTIEPHLLDDQIVLSASATAWTPSSSGADFRRAALGARFRSSYDPRGLVETVDAGIEAVSAAAPLSIWPGAGEGQARAPLLRAHPLLHDGILSGPVFGRRVSYGSANVERWLDRPAIAHVAVAVFTDIAQASQRLVQTEGDSFQIDAGVGVRVRVPGREGTLRADYAHGLRDGRNAVTFGWQK
jgi:hypothetical protein